MATARKETIGAMEELCELYGVTTQEELLHAFLKSLRGRSAPQQLRSRRIMRFRVVERIPGTNVATMGQKRYGFLVTLIENRKRWWASDIGHELGHTFFFDITKSPPGDRLHNIVRTKQGKREEHFCNRFTRIWARRYGKELYALLEEYGFSEDGLNRMVRSRR